MRKKSKTSSPETVENNDEQSADIKPMSESVEMFLMAPKVFAPRPEYVQSTHFVDVSTCAL